MRTNWERSLSPNTQSTVSSFKRNFYMLRKINVFLFWFSRGLVYYAAFVFISEIH